MRSAIIMTRIATDAAIPPRKGGVAYMKEITLRFEPDPKLDHIDVVIRAAARDEEVAALMARLSEPPSAFSQLRGYCCMPPP